MDHAAARGPGQEVAGTSEQPAAEERRTGAHQKLMASGSLPKASAANDSCGSMSGSKAPENSPGSVRLPSWWLTYRTQPPRVAGGAATPSRYSPKGIRCVCGSANTLPRSSTLLAVKSGVGAEVSTRASARPSGVTSTDTSLAPTRPRRYSVLRHRASAGQCASALRMMQGRLAATYSRWNTSGSGGPSNTSHVTLGT